MEWKNMRGMKEQYRLSGKLKETVQHLPAGCQKLAGT